MKLANVHVPGEDDESNRRTRDASRVLCNQGQRRRQVPIKLFVEVVRQHRRWPEGGTNGRQGRQEEQRETQATAGEEAAGAETKQGKGSVCGSRCEALSVVRQPAQDRRGFAPTARASRAALPPRSEHARKPASYRV